MTGSEHIRWVNKTECVIFSHRIELDTVQFPGGPSTVYSIHSSIPSNPQEFQSVWLVVEHSRTYIDHVNMVNPENSSVSVWVIGVRFAIIVA